MSLGFQYSLNRFQSQEYISENDGVWHPPEFHSTCPFKVLRLSLT